MKNKHWQYSKAVDPHIYIGPDGSVGCQNRGDWIDLALAALDQGEFSEKDQEVIRWVIEYLSESHEEGD